MLTKKEWEQFEKLVDGECYTQIEDFGADAALKDVQLALAVLEGVRVSDHPIRVQALTYVYHFSEWQSAYVRNLLSAPDRDQLELWEAQGGPPEDVE